MISTTMMFGALFFCAFVMTDITEARMLTIIHYLHTTYDKNFQNKFCHFQNLP